MNLIRFQLLQPNESSNSDTHYYYIDTESYMTFIYDPSVKDKTPKEQIITQICEIAAILNVDKKQFKSTLDALPEPFESEDKDGKYSRLYERLYNNCTLKYSSAEKHHNNKALMLTKFRFQSGYISPAESFFVVHDEYSSFLRDDDQINVKKYTEMAEYSAECWEAEESENSERLVRLLAENDQIKNIVLERVENDHNLLKDLSKSILALVNEYDEEKKRNLLNVLKNLQEIYSSNQFKDL